MLGVSAKFIDSAGARPACEPVAHPRAPQPAHDLLHRFAAVARRASAYVYERVKADVHLASISGGTDLCGCLVGGDPTGPVYAGEIQRPALGMAIDVGADDGTIAAESPGGPASWSAPRRSRRCRSASGVTTRRRAVPATAPRTSRGSPAVGRTATSRRGPTHGGMVIHGRSDATLNPGGVRIGTAEIYRRRGAACPRWLEALVFGQQWDDDVRIVLLVRLADGRGARRRPRGRDPPRDPHRAARRATSPRSSPRSTTCRAPAATSWSSSPWPTPCTAGRSATPKRHRQPGGDRRHRRPARAPAVGAAASPAVASPVVRPG